jgi:hypothetical protein
MGPKQFAELDWQKPCYGRLVDAARQFCSTGEASQIAGERNSVLRVELRTMELAASHELSYHLTKRCPSIHMLCSGYAKVNPTGIESIDHL